MQVPNVHYATSRRKPMTSSKTFRAGLILASALGLAACAGGYGGVGYGGMAYNSDYDRYYGDSSGYNAVPYGYAGSNFGWSGSYYYPGTGNMVYDRGGKQRQWSSHEQRYWQDRAKSHGHGNNGRHRGDKHGNEDNYQPR
jgi:hypothetical protein